MAGRSLGTELAHVWQETCTTGREHGRYLDVQDGRKTLDWPSEMETPPKGIRTPVLGLKSRCPRPLDDGGPASPRDTRCLPTLRQTTSRSRLLLDPSSLLGLPAGQHRQSAPTAANPRPRPPW